MIKFVFFDLDGVLVDACDWHKQALNLSLLEVANIMISDEEHYKIFNGLPTKTKLDILIKEKKIKEEQYQKISQRKQEITIELINSKCHIDNSKIELINFLKNKNIIVCCYTNSIRKTAELMLNKIGIIKKLDALITNEDVKYPKPNPEGYLTLINKFNARKEECLIVEDSQNGILAAHESGANVLKVNCAKEVNIKLFEGKI